jgi:hypothetical protein
VGGDPLSIKDLSAWVSGGNLVGKTDQNKDKKFIPSFLTQKMGFCV